MPFYGTNSSVGRRKSGDLHETHVWILPDFCADDKCRATDYSMNMTRSFRHKGVEAFFYSGGKAGSTGPCCQTGSRVNCP